MCLFFHMHIIFWDVLQKVAVIFFGALIILISATSHSIVKGEAGGMFSWSPRSTDDDIETLCPCLVETQGLWKEGPKKTFRVTNDVRDSGLFFWFFSF